MGNSLLRILFGYIGSIMNSAERNAFFSNFINGLQGSCFSFVTDL